MYATIDISIKSNIFIFNIIFINPSKKDFISKLEIALKEASETGYWLELAYRTNYIDEKQYKTLSDKCTTLRVILVSSCRTAKPNIDNK